MIPQWRKSSRSGGISDQACVEVARVSGATRLRRDEGVSSPTSGASGARVDDLRQSSDG
ncbi:DUF397 domain-containing protein [Actinoallomurus iriomotensis]|uniref:DUF397 domain-containing protein n=1 Tax=Actinoallomurus iriomotensis TaxID=478107 RepID=A0A9W6RMI7_9ACTN|nr:DUF397 domain-containing protein [Actinoallomurus iriomotensis]GLY77820.1 hypothetical protein Airi01_060870 [Actinoallomurus iriomotensis]